MAGPWEAYQSIGTASGTARAGSSARGTNAAPPPATGTTEHYLMQYRALPADQAAALYQRQRASLEGRGPRALARFDNDPRVRAIRMVAGLQPMTTPRAELQDVARRARSRQITEAGRAAARSREGSAPAPLRALSAGIRRSLFGIPERIAAAIPVSGSDLSYGERLQAIRAGTDEELSASLPGNIIGQVVGSLASGRGAGNLISAGATRLASAAAPVVSRAGNFLQNLTTLQRGQSVRNVGRVALAGGAGGAAQAAGEGSDIATGAGVGAVAAPVLHGAIRGAVGAGRIVRGAVGRRPADSILRSIVSSPPETIAARRAEIQRDTGAEPTIYEALPLGDRQAFDEAVKRMPASARERLVEHVGRRAQSMVTETADRAREIIRPRADDLTNTIAGDLARSRGAAAPTPEEIALARRAARSPLDMEDVADTEAANIMRPFDALEAYPAVNDLLPQHPVNRGSTVQMVADDPDVAAMIRSAAGPLRIADRPVTVRDITAMMSALSKTVNRSTNHIERDTADRALQHLEDILARDHPDVLPAIQQMRTAYAARMRMMEGVSEGSRTRLRENIDPGTNSASRAARNAYDTPEGASGRTLGQAAELERGILTSPNQAFGALDEIATNPTAQQAIGRNLGQDEATALTNLARTQTESARRLSRLAREQTGDEGGNDTLGMMRNLLSLSPGTMPFTKIQGILGTIRQFTRMPERSANRVVEMLLSQNPAQVSQAIGILSRTGEPGRRALRDIAISVGALATPGGEASTPTALGGETVPASEAPAEPVIPEAPAEAPATEPGPWDTYNSDVPYGRQVVEALFPGVVVTDDIRDPESDLGRANPGSNHIRRDGAVDVRPIEGMTFDQFVQKLRDEGHEIIEAIDEVNNPSGHATGPHWHVVLA